MWFPAEIRRGGYRVTFTAEVPEADRTGGDAGRYFFVPADAEKSATEGWVDGKDVYHVEVKYPDVSGLRLSVVRSFKEPQPKNIRFVPKS